MNFQRQNGSRVFMFIKEFKTHMNEKVWLQEEHKLMTAD